MASEGDEVAGEVALAEQLFEDGIEALDEGSFVEASDLLSQALQMKAASTGDESVEAALVCIKYGAALLGCARLTGTDVLGGLAKVRSSEPVLRMPGS